MAHSSVFMGFLLAVLVASAHASPTKDEALSHAADDNFLRACCSNTTNAAVCYNSLHLHAASFKGNLVKVASASSVIAFTWLRSFDAELCSLLRGGTGAGESVDKAIKSCLNGFEVVLFHEDDVLAKLRRLETAAGRREKHAKSNLNDVNLGVGNVASATGLTCMDDFVSLGKGILASPMGKKMLAMNATISLYGAIALDLVASIKL